MSANDFEQNAPATGPDPTPLPAAESLPRDREEKSRPFDAVADPPRVEPPRQDSPVGESPDNGTEIAPAEPSTRPEPPVPVEPTSPGELSPSKPRFTERPVGETAEATRDRAGSGARRAWWRYLVGPRGPQKYKLREIGEHVWRDHVLWPQAWFHLLLFGLLVFVFWMNAMNYWVGVIDDAYITFRYADHFIHGQGLVYNLGERVQGFTSFLWMVIIGVVIGLKGDPMFWAKALGFLSAVGVMAGVAYFGSCFSRRRDPWNWMAAVPLAACAHFAHWSVMGLETQFQVMLIVWTFARFYREMHDARAWLLSPFLAALAAMTRVESLYYMTPLAAYALVQVARGRLDWRRFFRWGLWAAAVFVPYFLWKYSYFGDLAPNTYYAKKVYQESHDRGIAHILYWYFGQGDAFKNLWFLPLLAALLWARPVTILILGPLVLNVYYVYHVDGDWMPNLRFFQISAPFLGLLLVVGIRWVQRVLHDWRGKPAPPPEGHNGVLWVAAEIVVFGSWFWLLFIKARPVFAAGKPGNNLVWIIAVIAFATIMIMRWFSGWGEGKRRRRERESGAGTAYSPARAGEWRRLVGDGQRVKWITLEWATFLAFGALMWLFAPKVGDVIGLIRNDAQIASFDFGFSHVVPPVHATVPSISPYLLFYGVVAVLVIGWLVRWLTRGRLARSLVRWPVYAGLALLIVFYTHVQLGIGSVYIFSTTPSSYPRATDALRWKNIVRAMHSGFSPPLQNVADWMLDNCQRNTTIFMSDIGYPMWLNPYMNLIDVDGLTNKVLADAPSVRGKNKSAEEYIRETIRKWKLRRGLPPAQVNEIANRARDLAAKQKGANEKTEREIQDRLIREAKLEMPLSPDQERQARFEAIEHGYKVDRNERNAEYVLRRRPEYMNLFMQHKNQNDPKSPGYVYPDISRDVYDSPEFKKNYVQVATMNKYIASWNHFFRRKDVKVGISPQEKVRRLMEGVRRNPEMSYLYLQLAEAMVAAGTPYAGEPKEILHSAVRRFRGNGQFLSRLADWGHKHDHNELALMAWETSLKSNPRQDWLYRQICEYYISKGEFEKAIKMGRQAIESPSYRGDQYLLGILTRISDRAKAQNQKKYADAVWKMVIEAKPNQDWLYRRAADYYVEEGHLDEAIGAVKAGIPYCSGTGLYLHLAYLLEKAGRIKEAESTLLEAAKKDNRSKAREYLDLGALRGRHNLLKAAIEAYREALKIDSNNGQAKRAIADLQERLNRRSDESVTPAPSRSETPRSATSRPGLVRPGQEELRSTTAPVTADGKTSRALPLPTRVAPSPKTRQATKAEISAKRAAGALRPIEPSRTARPTRGSLRPVHSGTGSGLDSSIPMVPGKVESSYGTETRYR